MSKKVTTIYVEESLDQYAKELATEITRDPDLPDFSKTRVMRELIQLGAISLTEDDQPATEGSVPSLAEADGGSLLLPELDASDLVSQKELIKFRREQIKDDQWVEDIRGGFEGRIKKEFLKRFENGYRPDDMATLAAGYMEEARTLWPDDPDRQADAIQYIKSHMANYREQYQRGTDVLDPDEAYNSFSGVQDAEKWEDVTDDQLMMMVEDVRDRWQSANAGGSPSKPAFTQSVVNEYGVDEEIAERVVDAATTMIARNITDPQLNPKQNGTSSTTSELEPAEDEIDLEGES